MKTWMRGTPSAVAMAALLQLVVGPLSTVEAKEVNYRGFPAAVRDDKQVLVRPGDAIEVVTHRGKTQGIVTDAWVTLTIDTDLKTAVGKYRLAWRWVSSIGEKACTEIREYTYDLSASGGLLRLERFEEQGVGTILSNVLDGDVNLAIRPIGTSPVCTTYSQRPLTNRRSLTMFLVRQPGFTVATESALSEHFMLLYENESGLPTPDELRAGAFARDRSFVAGMWLESEPARGAGTAPTAAPTGQPKESLRIVQYPRFGGGVEVRTPQGTWKRLPPNTAAIPIDAEIRITGRRSTLKIAVEKWGTVEFGPGFAGRIESRIKNERAIKVFNLAAGYIFLASDPEKKQFKSFLPPYFVSPAARVEVKGTKLSIDHDAATETTTVDVQEGTALVTPANTSLSPATVNAGQRVTVTLSAIGPVTTGGSSTVTSGGGSTPPASGRTGAAPGAMPIEGPPQTLHTLVYHQLTTDGMAGGCFPVLSDDGSRIVVAPEAYPCPVQVMGFDGAGRRTVMQLDRVPGSVDISADGSRVLANHNSRELFTASVGGQRQALVQMHDPELAIARLSGDGRSVVFLLGRPIAFAGDTKPRPEGLWSVAAGGGNPRQVVNSEQMRRVLGLPPTEGVAWNRKSLDVSHDGGRIVFGVVSYGATNLGPKILTVRGDGTDLRVVAEGTRDNRGHVGSASITPDGRRVAYMLVSWGQPPFVGVVSSAGGDGRVISKGGGGARFSYPDGNLMSDPMRFTSDGAWLLLGTSGILVATDGSDRLFHLPATRSTGGKVLLSGSMLRATMDATAQRFAFFCGDERNSQQFKQLTQLAAMEIDPPSVGVAPRISEVGVQPGYLIPNEVSTTVSARVDTDHALVLVTNVATHEGMIDPGIASELLYDDGRTVGDETAGDGVFTNNRIYATQTVRMGPHQMRVDAEAREAQGRRHATAVVVGPVPVGTEKPPEPAAVVTAPPATPPATPAFAGMRIEAEHRRVAEHELVTVPVWLKDAVDVANVNFEVLYDPGVARPEGDMIKGNMLGRAIFSANPRETGRVRIGFAQTGGLSGTGTVAYLPMRAVGRPGDETPLGVVVTTIDDPQGAELGIRRIDGSIVIVGPDGQVPGDCDGDGVVTAADAMCALMMSVGNMAETTTMDVDENGKVTSGDARVLLKRAVGIGS